MKICAEFLGRLEADLFAGQIHYLGRWYGTQSGCPKDAVIAVEISIGSGEAVLVALRDGREGRPAYKNLYRHVMSSRPTMDTAKAYGFPANPKTRPLILNQLEKATRDFALPYVTENLLYQMEEFVHHDSGTSPRARAGSHDDCVLAASIALEMYRLYGEHEHRPRKRAKKPLKAYPWEPQAA
jgi:hypothetical protein